MGTGVQKIYREKGRGGRRRGERARFGLGVFNRNDGREPGFWESSDRKREGKVSRRREEEESREGG